LTSRETAREDAIQNVSHRLMLKADRHRAIWSIAHESNVSILHALLDAAHAESSKVGDEVARPRPGIDDEVGH
jgi:hypothetical protein